MTNAVDSELDFRRNLLVDQDNPILVQKAWRDHRSDGVAYLGVRHGEDALTWNVFRFLDKEGALEVAQRLFGLEYPIEEVLFWGCDPDARPSVQQDLNILIRYHDGRRRGTMTEPDLVFVTSHEICFVECKVSCTRDAWSATGGGWRKRWADYRTIPHIGGRLAENPGTAERDAYQLFRNAIYAALLSDRLGRKAAKVAGLVSSKWCSRLQEVAAVYRAFAQSTDFVEVLELRYWEELVDRVPKPVASKIKLALNDG